MLSAFISSLRTADLRRKILFTLGIADLGPLAPGTVDPDAGSGRIRKVTTARQHQPR